MEGNSYTHVYNLLYPLGMHTMLQEQLATSITIPATNVGALERASAV